jgi:hypothetical protein
VDAPEAHTSRASKASAAYKLRLLHGCLRALQSRLRGDLEAHSNEVKGVTVVDPAESMRDTEGSHSGDLKPDVVAAGVVGSRLPRDEAHASVYIGVLDHEAGMMRPAHKHDIPDVEAYLCGSHLLSVSRTLSKVGLP